MQFSHKLLFYVLQVSLQASAHLYPAAFKLDEEIACYCSDEEIQKLADEELVEIIYEWQRL